MKHILVAFFLFLAGSASVFHGSSQPVHSEYDSYAQNLSAERVGGNATGSVSVMRAEGPIGPPEARSVQRGLVRSIENRDEILIIELVTPGASLDSTQEIVQALVGCRHPTAVHVAPQGANAGRA